MAQVINTVHGPLLCSRINAGATERGDLVVSDDGLNRLWMLIDVHRDYHTDHVILHVAGEKASWRVRLGVNTPIWRAVGARAAGPIS